MQMSRWIRSLKLEYVTFLLLKSSHVVCSWRRTTSGQWCQRCHHHLTRGRHHGVWSPAWHGTIRNQMVNNRTFSNSTNIHVLFNLRVIHLGEYNSRLDISFCQFLKINCVWHMRADVCRFKDSKELYRGRKYEMLFWNNKASLVIKDTEPSDSAKYRCEISNALGRVQSSGKLTVYSKYWPLWYVICNISTAIW